MDPSHIATCQDLTEEDFALACASRESAYKLLNHVSAICQPDTGEERVLLFLARCAPQNWIDGDLRVEVRLQGMFECHLVLLCGLGGDAFEVMKRISLPASFLAFKQLADHPEQVLPLVLTSADSERLVFDASAQSRANSIPPEDFTAAQRRLEQKLQRPAPAPDLAPDTEAPRQDAAEQDAPPSSRATPGLPFVEPSASSTLSNTSQAVARIALARRHQRSPQGVTEVQLQARQGEDGRYRSVCEPPAGQDKIAAAAAQPEPRVPQNAGDDAWANSEGDDESG